MILGIGSDLCDIRRIERSLERFGARFTHRIFTAGERARSERRAAAAASYARRIAAKEACAKALGTGLRAGVIWRDMEVVNLASGRLWISFWPEQVAQGVATATRLAQCRSWPEFVQVQSEFALSSIDRLTRRFVVIEPRPAT